MESFRETPSRIKILGGSSISLWEPKSRTIVKTWNELQSGNIAFLAASPGLEHALHSPCPQT
jgi:hypothetical protein